MMIKCALVIVFLSTVMFIGCSPPPQSMSVDSLRLGLKGKPRSLVLNSEPMDKEGYEQASQLKLYFSEQQELIRKELFVYRENDQAWDNTLVSTRQSNKWVHSYDDGEGFAYSIESCDGHICTEQHYSMEDHQPTFKDTQHYGQFGIIKVVRTTNTNSGSVITFSRNYDFSDDGQTLVVTTRDEQGEVAHKVIIKVTERDKAGNWTKRLWFEEGGQVPIKVETQQFSYD